MTKPYVHSYSGLKEFEQCPRKFQANRILKLYPYKETEATRYGNEVHKALEDYTNLQEPIPPKHGKFKPVVDAVLQKPGRHKAEVAYGVRRDLSPCGFFDKGVWFRGKIDHLTIDDDALKAWIVDWKGLALDTPIPTPFGWTTMGNIRVGDLVFDAAGEPTLVVGKSAVKNLPCFKVTFDDTTSVVCDEEHLWKLADGSVVGVRELMGQRKKNQRVKPPRIAVAAPLALKDVDLPVDPYVLGLWLADGKLSSGEISKPDTFVWEEVQRRGYNVDMSTGGSGPCPTRTVKGLRRQLMTLGLLGVKKFIPHAYTRAGYHQRLDLLRGLMDGDGNANPTRKQAVFTTTSQELSKQVCELLCTLGQRPLPSEVVAHGFGVTTKAFPVSFRPIGINPFLLPRKASRIDPEWGTGHSGTRIAVSVEEVPSVPTQCIAVDSADHTFLCTERMIPTHNTGKNKYPDLDQMVCMSLLTFAHNAHLRQINSALLFLLYDDMRKKKMVRDDVEKEWWQLRERLARVEAAIASNSFHPKQGPLCGKWCEHIKCEHNGRH